MAIMDQRDERSKPKPVTVNMIARERRNRMQLPANRCLELDDSWHSYAPLPASLSEKYEQWFFVEEEMPGEAAVNDART